MIFTGLHAIGVSAQTKQPIVRLAKIEVDAAQAVAYKALLKEEIETSLRIEPRVISLNAVFETNNPARITIIETYADSAAYLAHLKRPHFLKYKADVKDLVKKLELADVTPVAGTRNSNQQQNIAADNILLSVFESGDVSKLDNIIAPDFYNHTGGHTGIEPLKTSIKMFHEHMKTVKLEVIKQFADEDSVSEWTRYTGADPADTIEGMEVTKYKDGKAVEHWFFPYGGTKRS